MAPPNGKKNCWEAKQCGREPGGAKSLALGVCPAATETSFDGVHGGKNGGRACWVLSGTLCGGVVQGTFATKMGNCLSCEFYKAVRHAEGAAFQSSRDLLARAS